MTRTLLETQLPVSLLSKEAYKERKAGPGQTLTCLGSYWKGRKPLILVRACVLAGLIPASADPKMDRLVFLMLMRMDEESLRVRKNKPVSPSLVAKALGDEAGAYVENQGAEKLAWKAGIGAESRLAAQDLAWSRLNYDDKLTLCRRPEEVGEEEWPDVWDRVNSHLGTQARSIPQLVEQLGVAAFGHRPRLADPFCGGGSIPFEAARMGCDVYASDLNPIAGMLTWGALNVVGGSPEQHEAIGNAQDLAAAAVRSAIDALGVEEGEDGWRGKVYFYCLEITCPQTGWKIPLAPSWVISETHRVVATLSPDAATKSFRIELVQGATQQQMTEAKRGTVRDNTVHHPLAAFRHVVHSMATLRGDRADGENGLRRWERTDFEPRPADLFQERLYGVQWLRERKSGRPELKFASATVADLAREERARSYVAANLGQWQAEGWVPDMQIEEGDNTSQPIKERGWAYWHHLFGARQLLTLVAIRRMWTDIATRQAAPYLFASALDNNNKLCHWNPGVGKDCAINLFYNQAFNTFSNWCARGTASLENLLRAELSRAALPPVEKRVTCSSAETGTVACDLLVTDPPYGDAVNYHEITEFFIAWLRKRPPDALKDWVWDSRRALAVKGSGREFRVAMVEAFSNFACQMSDSGLQVVMFTHSSADVWASLVHTLWGAGLQVKAAWYLLTETSAGVRDANLVQGTTLLVLRKRHGERTDGFSGRLPAMVRKAVKQRVEELLAIDDADDPNFGDLDLIQAGYAAACEVLTQYSSLDGADVRADVLQPTPAATGRRGAKGSGLEATKASLVVSLLKDAAKYASEQLIPRRLDTNRRGADPADRTASDVWASLHTEERFVLKALDAEADGSRKVGNLMELSRLFGVDAWQTLLASSGANDARLRTAAELGADEIVTRANLTHAVPKLPAFAQGVVRHALYGIKVALETNDLTKATRFFADSTPQYWERRQSLLAILEFLGQIQSPERSDEAALALSLAGAVRNHVP